jgi:hypothetical protein
MGFYFKVLIRFYFNLCTFIIFRRNGWNQTHALDPPDPALGDVEIPTGAGSLRRDRDHPLQYFRDHFHHSCNIFVIITVRDSSRICNGVDNGSMCTVEHRRDLFPERNLKNIYTICGITF